MNSNHTIFSSLKHYLLIFCILVGINRVTAQDVTKGELKGRLYENKKIGFIIKNIPENWQVSLNPKVSSYAPLKFPIFETLGDSFQILVELKDSSRKSLDLPLRIFLGAQLIQPYESKDVKSAQEFFKLNVDRVMSEHATGYPKYVFYDVKTSLDVGGDIFKYQCVDITDQENLKHQQTIFCAVKEEYYFIILVDSYCNDFDFNEVLRLFQCFWWIK